VVAGRQFGDYLDIRLPGVWVRVIRRDDAGFTMDIFPFIATVEWAPEPTPYVIVKTINLWCRASAVVGTLNLK
jgi:hypothetical protein